MAIEIKVPDIGDFKDVPVIEILVKPGDAVNKEDSLVTLESDKATMEVPSSHTGTVREIRVKVGDKVSQGTLIAILDAAGAADAAPSPAPAPAKQAPAPAAPSPAAASGQASGQTVRQALNSTLASLDSDLHAEVLVLGAGPGGYTAAFRAADLGKKVVLVERYASLGGVCLNVGCIPSKALLHAAKIITDAEEGAHLGPHLRRAQDRARRRAQVQGRRRRQAHQGPRGTRQGAQGHGDRGQGPVRLAADARSRDEGRPQGRVLRQLHHRRGLAVGAHPGLPLRRPAPHGLHRGAAAPGSPKRLLIIGGGIIGLEMATVYDALGSKVSVVEFMDRLIPGADPDIVKPLARRIEKRYEKILLKTKVARIEATPAGLKAHFEAADGGAGPAPEVYDRVLLSVGRRPNGKNIGAEKAGIRVDERGWIPVDRQMRTNVPHIFAIGDIVGEPMLAHKATHEGKLAAEVIAGMNHHSWEARTIPSVAYTDPEVAWMGLSEAEAKAQGVEYEKAVFPWAASGRALGMGREEGLTKVLYAKGSKRILGAGIVGVNAGELIAETVLALEMGADAEDIGLTIHAHPTLSETVFFTAEIAEGSITDMMPPKKAG
jgi:dihydrolipoamide dehydrogenase